MLSKRLTSIINNTPSPGINTDGVPTINVCGEEIVLDLYWRILDMAESGRSKDEIIAHIITIVDFGSADALTRVGSLIYNILENGRLCNATGTILAVKHVRASVVPSLHSKSRKSTVLQKARRVTTHISSSEPSVLLPVSPEREEEKLVVEALKLAAERDAVKKSMPDSNAKRRATATIDRQLKESLQRHQAVEDDMASDDARTRIELARQNLN